MEFLIANIKILDTNSFYHFLIPLFLGLLLRKKWKLGIWALLAFEIFERIIGRTIKVSYFYLTSLESFWNSFADILIGTLGLYLGYKLISYHQKK